MTTATEIKRMTTNGDRCDCCYGRSTKAKYRRLVPHPIFNNVEQAYQYLCGIHAKHPTLPWYVGTWYSDLPLDQRPEGGLFALVGEIEPIP